MDSHCLSHSLFHTYIHTALFADKGLEANHSHTQYHIRGVEVQVQCLAHGHFGTRTGGTRNWATEVTFKLVNNLPQEVEPFKVNHDDKLVKRFMSILSCTATTNVKWNVYIHIMTPWICGCITYFQLLSHRAEASHGAVVSVAETGMCWIPQKTAHVLLTTVITCLLCHVWQCLCFFFYVWGLRSCPEGNLTLMSTSVASSVEWMAVRSVPQAPSSSQ